MKGREGMLPISVLVPLLLFMALLLALSLYGLAASGHFPREHRALAPGLGAIVLFGSIAVAIVCLVAALASVWHLIPWYAAIIGGGLSILVAPLVLQQFPDSFVNGRGALLSLCAASVILALLLLRLTYP